MGNCASLTKFYLSIEYRTGSCALIFHPPNAKSYVLRAIVAGRERIKGAIKLSKPFSKRAIVGQWCNGFFSIDLFEIDPFFLENRFFRFEPPSSINLNSSISYHRINRQVSLIKKASYYLILIIETFNYLIFYPFFSNSNFLLNFIILININY